MTVARRAALACALLALPASARAQTAGRFRLAWARDATASACPDGASLARAVSARLGRDPFVNDDNAPSIEGTVRRDELRWVARIVARDAFGATVGSREFTSTAADCVPITQAVTLGVALSIDPEAALRPPAPPPPVTPPVTPPAPTPTPAPALTPRRSLAPWWRRASASVGGVVAAGIVPETGAGFVASAEGSPLAWLRVRGGVRYLLTSESESHDVAFGLVVASVSACWEPLRVGVLAAGACAGVEAGSLRAYVLRGAPGDAGDHPWVAATLGARARLHVVGPVAAELSADAVAPVVSPRFTSGSDVGATLFQPSVVSVVGAAALALQFR